MRRSNGRVSNDVGDESTFVFYFLDLQFRVMQCTEYVLTIIPPEFLDI